MSAEHIPAHAPPLGGTATEGTINLTANTWTQCPTTIPTKDYVLVFTPATTATGDLRWCFLGSGTPGATVGQVFTGSVALAMKGGESVDVASTVANDDVNWTCKEID